MNPKTIKIIIELLKKWGPVIAATGIEIYNKTKERFGNKSAQRETSTKITVEELDIKVSQLEQNDLDQAKLLSEMAQQSDNLSKLTIVLATRIMYAFIIAGISLIIMIYLLIRSFVR